MTPSEALKRAAATFVAGATATPLVAELLDVSVLKAAGAAGIIALWNLAGRLAQAWLRSNPEPDGEAGAGELSSLLVLVALVVAILCGLKFLGVI